MWAKCGQLLWMACVVWFSRNMCAEARKATRPPYCIGWEDPESREFKFAGRYERAEPDACKLEACVASSQPAASDAEAQELLPSSVRASMCRFVYADGENPIKDSTTAVIYNKPLKQGSTSIYTQLRALFESTHGAARVGEDLDKQVLLVKDQDKESGTARALAKTIKFWGWHIQLSAAKLQMFSQLRSKEHQDGGSRDGDGDEIVLLTSMRSPYSQVVSLFFEVHHNRLETEREFFTVANLVRFIEIQGKNNNFDYHFGSREGSSVDCAAIEVNTGFSARNLPCARRTSDGSMPSRSASAAAMYKALLPLSEIRSEPVKRAVYASLCLDHMLYAALARRRAFLLRAYSGLHA
ncbi:hypothetical protein FVE85_2509 [Porphyridium purpureum]|uniref:Uncharacterized protein n=1 Tax=Porphyridium purpureum TaxID=35688 RepID=A0A5J4YLC3_PORPP|nr:hypothetical protein FVE85_2509 [Porphyridium purpureum]|eukprot:POR6300..scf291_13